jgi:hypothetical protein
MSVANPTPDEVVEVLDKAIALMNNTGKHWTQNAFKRILETDMEGAPIDHAYCSVGAIRAVSGIQIVDYASNPLADAATDAVARATIPHADDRRKEEWSEGLSTIAVVTGWNDDGDTTWEKVVRRFKRARSRVLARKELGLKGF